MADTKDTIICPACGKVMKKIFLEEQGFNADVCTEGCGGIFLDNFEFKKIANSKKDILPILKEYEGKTFEKTDENKKRRCPVCGHNMVKNYTDKFRNIEIDECYTCGGKFFDYNELKELRKE